MGGIISSRQRLVGNLFDNESGGNTKGGTFLVLNNLLPPGSIANWAGGKPCEIWHWDYRAASCCISVDSSYPPSQLWINHDMQQTASWAGKFSGTGYSQAYDTVADGICRSDGVNQGYVPPRDHWLFCQSEPQRQFLIHKEADEL